VLPIKDNIPTERFPFVTVALIVANVVVYLLAIRHGGSLIGGPDIHEVVKFGAIPYAFSHPGQHCGLVTVSQQSGSIQTIVCHGQRGTTGTPTGFLPVWETAFTAMFMHASIIQVAANMLFLWIFGNTVEDALGALKFLIFYVLGGLAALALLVALDPDSASPTIGASGAIAAVLGGYIVLYPQGGVLTLVFIIFFFTVIELPTFVMLGIWFVQQALFGALGLTEPTGGGGAVAYFAHVGGLVFGALTIRLFASKHRQMLPPDPVY
jgi:membrane associated rhomboid family serine protease